MTKNGLITLFRGGGAPQKVNLKGFRGFTLAEVLITLVIIGVIAAMTIPTLMNNTNKQEYSSRLKKAYSTMAQVTNRIIAEEGNPRGDIGGWATSTQVIYNTYKKYLSRTTDCPKGTTGCFAGTYKHLRKTTSPSFNTGSRYGFILSDGTEIILRESDFSNTCSKSGAGTNNLCQFIFADINGIKGPNIVGIDVYAFALKENDLVPAGCDSDGDCTNTSDGWGCACKVLREGAINY